MALKWQGQVVTKRLEAAMVTGVNQTMAACVQHAKRHHRWINRSGTLEGGIDIAEFARRTGTAVRGVWGVRDVVYALIQEVGGTIRPRHAKALVFKVEDHFVRVKKVTIPARPYLRPAAEAEYPKLPARIRRAMDRSAGSR